MTAQYATVENKELLQVADAVAREKGLDKEELLDAVEQAVQVAGRRKYGHELNIRAHIDRKSGVISMYRVRDIVELEDEIEDSAVQICLKDALVFDEKAEIGGEIAESLPPIDFGRIAAQTAKQVIIQRVRDAEREKQYEEFKDRVGEIVNGVVKRIERGDIVIEVGRLEAIIRRDQTIPRENLRQGERVRAYVYDVRRERTGPQIFLSRTHPIFMAKLFAQEVPEIYDGVIEIKAVARDPGSRAKICVTSNDMNIDPVGSCVGVRGSRVQAVISELQGEKIDILPWSNDPATMVVAALAPAEVEKVVVDEIKHRLIVVVPDDQLSQAIGRRGQNIRLASQVVGWEIDAMTEEEEAKARSEEFSTLTKRFIDALNVEDVIAELLVSEGFRTLEEVAYIENEELASVEGFDPDIAEELRRRAQEYLDLQQESLNEKVKEYGMDPELQKLDGMAADLMISLGEKGVKTRDDLADLSHDEFVDLIPNSGLTREDIDQLIMNARAHWFDGDDEDAVAEDESAA